MSEPHPYEEDLNRSYQVGIYTGLDQAAAFLMREATKAFENGGRDAENLRRLSVELKKRSDAAHPGVKKP